jgi:hypothetical protein
VHSQEIGDKNAIKIKFWLSKTSWFFHLQKAWHTCGIIHKLSCCSPNEIERKYKQENWLPTVVSRPLFANTCDCISCKITKTWDTKMKIGRWRSSSSSTGIYTDCASSCNLANSSWCCSHSNFLTKSTGSSVSLHIQANVLIVTFKTNQIKLFDNGALFL